MGGTQGEQEGWKERYGGTEEYDKERKETGEYIYT